ncbi:cytochrome c oxidase assembly protein PET191-domain-containing protein [Dioszegia hungarica]|uniref:Cytochrome c oxidase assembly protein PET191-domain-containing protein n=1 Tax=Dioszegia hungarica TaxID=4972 RepID=A0AA38H3P8_9TREE|nr:cytochrome c oxidase assembly protein PET191-domain-containing protein [Dioszegia hungarica]KAI9633366.1 cytochrome c oxidase assembly protein PET191-domain-containing protein [Dioszegia hungarica]
MTGAACQSIRDDLVACLLRTDCVLRSGKTPQECLKSPDLPIQCQHLITAFADCKKGMLDPKRRFRGNHLSHREAGNDGFGAGQGVVDIDPEDKKR